jgi:4-diphosphocytidyl-2-C-methyl-D-erythritol kinase
VIEPTVGRWTELAPAKINLALHVRGKMADGRHALETLFAFCTDGDRLAAEPANDLRLTVEGPFADDLVGEENIVETAARRLAEAASVSPAAHLLLEKNLPVASGIGGGSADAAAALRLLTAMWGLDPALASAVAPTIGADVPACLLSMTARGEGAGERLQLIDDPAIHDAPVLLINPGTALSTAQVFAGWDGVDRGELLDWSDGRNDLEPAAIAMAPEIATVLDWLRGRAGAEFVRMSGSGATCFAMFSTTTKRDAAKSAVPERWWRLATTLR